MRVARKDGPPTGGPHVQRALPALAIAGALVITTRAQTGAAGMQELLGIAPTGKPFSMTVAFIYQLRDHKIVREQRIYDFTGMLIQIGVLKARPAT